jgi:quinoprotein relay system zinc metallohydrolase 1
LKPEKLADGVWMIPGAQEAITQSNGGAIANISILDTQAGAVIVDTGPSLRFGTALSELATELTGKPVARVYVTHFHPDHVFGNQAFDADVIATTSAVLNGLEALGEAFSDSMYRSVGEWMRGTEVKLPGKLLEDDVEDFGDRRIRCLPMRGHTDSDLVLFDELSGVMITGDLVFVDRAPTTPHADLERWRISLANLGGIPCSRVVPGHGPSETTDRGIRQTRDWLEAIYTIISGAFERGLDISEAVALDLPAWTKSIALARYEYERTVMHLYPKLEAARLPRVDGKT